MAGRFPWLSLVDPSKQFIFKIGGVPMRFYRGAAEEPSARTLQQSYPELSQLSLFPKEAEARDYAHRLAVETDIEGAVTAIKYVALSDEGPEFYWDIPLSGSVAAIRPIGEKPAEGVELPAPGHPNWRTTTKTRRRSRVSPIPSLYQEGADPSALRR
ncbi:MAG: hypothetical protein WDN03_07600 [Rhizomicrobium sp.]